MKRIFDLILSLTGIITLSPIIIFLSIGLFIANKGNPFYFQKRDFAFNYKKFYIKKLKNINL